MARLLPLLRLLLCASVAAAYTELRYTLNATDSSYVRALATSSADSGDRFAAPLPLCMSAGVFAEALARVAAADLLPGGIVDGRTVFAPSDTAFDAALSALSLSRASFFASPPERLAETLALHIAAPGQLPLNTRDVGTGAPARRISSALGAPPLLLERRMVARTDVVIVPSNIAGEPPTSQTVIVQVCATASQNALCGCLRWLSAQLLAALQLGAARAWLRLRRLANCCSGRDVTTLLMQHRGGSPRSRRH
jgi:hypothetical protein